MTFYYLIAELSFIMSSLLELFVKNIDIFFSLVACLSPFYNYIHLLEVQ